MILSCLHRVYVAMKHREFGDHIRIDVCALCQLHCPVCATWRIRDGVDWGYLKFKDFKEFVNRYPNFKHIEIANNGEIFLNPELSLIMRYAHEKGIRLTAHDGANLNDISEEDAENLVRYQLRDMQVSIDGASDGVYRIYRHGGSFDKVIANIRKINFYKKKHNAKFPKLIWKFIVFGHNEQEIPAARKMAEELDMEFELAFNVDPAYSPVRNKDFVRAQMGFSDIQEYEQAKNTKVNLDVCGQLWGAPQISWNGALLGCCCNVKPFPVNVFETGLERSVKNEQYVYAKKMVLGQAPPQDGIPCSRCAIFKWRQERKIFLHPKQVAIRILQKTRRDAARAAANG